MMSFKEFRYGNLDELIEESASLGLDLHFSENLKVLGKKVTIQGHTVPNSMAIHPMEGSDGNPDGSPGELTVRRYDRFSRGGAGLIWFEAVAVVPEGKAVPRQLRMDEYNLPEFQRLLEKMTQNAHREFGNNFDPLYIVQLTHSGRFSKPEGVSAPIIACKNPYFQERFKNENIAQVISDDELEALEDRYVETAVLAQKAGFHGVDVKACHRYLLSELLSAYTREGKYGGDFEGRTRFLLNVVDKIKSRLGSNFMVASRLNIYDGIPYPYGWGVDQEDYRKYDLTEPLRLVKLLHDKGVRLLNLTMGTPYYNPHVNRPYDKGGYVPDEHPLQGVSRLVKGVGEVQQACPDMAVVGTGYSWLRQFSANLGAGSLEKGLATLIGFGREAFAYPDFARDILTHGALDRRKCCITCGKCAEILRAGGTTGCVVRDPEIYVPAYREFCGS